MGTGGSCLMPGCQSEYSFCLRGGSLGRAGSCSFSIHCTSPLLWDWGGAAAAARGGSCYGNQRKHFFTVKNGEIAEKQQGDMPVKDVRAKIF